MAKLNRLCVFTGSSIGAQQEYIHAAETLAGLFCKSNIGLVYGGAKIGLMGKLADAMLQQDGEVIGVMPEFLAEKEIAHEDITELHLVESMHERKKLMNDFADGFIMLPGGMGTLEEFFEVLTWSQLGLHKKPFAILNVNHYFDALIKFLDHSVAEGFLKPMYRDMIVIETTPEAVLEKFLNYQQPVAFRVKQDRLLETE